MLKKIIGASIGARLAKNSPVLGGTTGAMLATAVPFVISRLSIPAMIVIGIGGYAAKRYLDKRDDPLGEKADRNSPSPVAAAGKPISTGNAGLSSA